MLFRSVKKLSRVGYAPNKAEWMLRDMDARTIEAIEEAEHGDEVKRIVRQWLDDRKATDDITE